MCSACVDRDAVTPLYASEARRGRPPSPVPRPRSRTPSPVARAATAGGPWDSPTRTTPPGRLASNSSPGRLASPSSPGRPARVQSAPPPPLLVHALQARDDAPFPSLFGLQFQWLLWRRFSGDGDVALRLWGAVAVTGVLGILFAS